MGILHSAHLKVFPLHDDIILNGCVTPSSMYAPWFTIPHFWNFRVFFPFLTGIKSIAYGLSCKRFLLHTWFPW